jgi:FkbM family methyltransferase
VHLVGTLIRYVGRVSPSLERRLEWIRFRRGDFALRVVDELVRRGDLVIDIGASQGVYAARLSQLVGRRGRVIAFEPNPENFRGLEAVTGALPNVEAHPMGLSDSAKEVELHIPIIAGERQLGLGAVSVAGRRTSLEHEAVPVSLETLDAVVPPDMGQVAFVKCDVEGHEFAVLRGAEATLRRSRPPILIEIEQRHQDGDIQRTFDYLGELGYVGYSLHRGGVRPLSEFRVDRDQLEFLRPDFEVMPSPDYVHNFLFATPETDVARLLESKPARTS